MSGRLKIFWQGKVTYFDTFFTLACNEFLYLILQHRGRVTSKNKNGLSSVSEPKNSPLASPSPSLKWRLLNKILNLLYPIFYLLDAPFRILGVSNGFFLQGEKNQKSLRKPEIQ